MYLHSYLGLNMFSVYWPEERRRAPTADNTDLLGYNKSIWWNKLTLSIVFCIVLWYIILHISQWFDNISFINRYSPLNVTTWQETPTSLANAHSIDEKWSHFAMISFISKAFCRFVYIVLCSFIIGDTSYKKLKLCVYHVTRYLM